MISTVQYLGTQVRIRWVQVVVRDVVWLRGIGAWSSDSFQGFRWGTSGAKRQRIFPEFEEVKDVRLVR